MKPSTELFHLIKSLSKSEKRFFKLSSSLQSGEKNYLKIFEAIEKQDEYDEAELKEMFKKETFIKHLPSEKNHLYKLILKSLRSFHADNSISSILKQEIKNIEILYKKSLYKECNKFIERAKKLAYDHEKFYYCFELLSWEKLLLEESFESGVFDKDLDALLEEEQMVIDKLRNLAEYQMLYSRINYVYRSGGFSRNEEERKVVDEIANHPLIKGKNTALSSRAATICYYVQGLCNATNRDYDTSFAKFRRVKEILDKNHLILQDLSKRYVRTLDFLLYGYTVNNQFSEAEELLETLKKLPRQKGFGSADTKMRVFITENFSALRLYFKKGEFEKAVELCESIVEEIEGYDQKLNKEHHITFFYYMAYAYFGVGDYSKALFWINRVLNDKENLLRQDIYSHARLFNLFVHFELGNLDLLEYIVKSTNRYLSKTKKDYEIEDVLIKYVRKLSRITNDADMADLVVKMKKDLLKLFEDPMERVALEYFDYLAWVDSKVKGVSLGEAVKLHMSSEKNMQPA